MAYSDSFPTQRAIFTLDAANAGRLDPRCSYTRSTTGTFFGTEKVLSSENLLLQSQTLDTTWASFGLNSSTPLTGSQTAPDGSSTAWQLNANTGVTDAPLVYQQPTLAASTAYTASVHVKAGTATHAYVSIRGAASHYAYAQIEFASPGSVSTGGAGFTGISGTVTALGSSWYRISVTCTTSTSVSSPHVHVGLSDGSAYTTSGYPTFTTGAETLLVWGAQLNTTGATVYDSPTTTQIARSYQTKLQTAAINSPRFEHSASDGESMGVLIESASTNLLVNSADFGGLWQIMNATKQSGAAIAPDGTLTATAYRENDGAGSKRLLCYYTHSGTDFTISVYAKLLGNTRRLVLRESQSSGLQTVFDLASGSVVSGTGSIKSVGNGWFRCELNGSHSSTNQAAGIYLVGASSDGSDVITGYTGDGYSGLLLAHPQAENQSWASSYIDTGTSGSTVSRAADSLSIDTSSFYTGGPFTIISETEGGYGWYPMAWALSDETDQNRVYVYRNFSSASDSTDWYLEARSSGSSVVAGTIGSSASAGKLAVSYNTNDVSFCASGGTVTTDTVASLPASASELQIGAHYDGANPLNGHVKRVALYNEALSDTNLQALTS